MVHPEAAMIVKPELDEKRVNGALALLYESTTVPFLFAIVSEWRAFSGTLWREPSA